MNYFTPAEFVENYALIGEKKSNAPVWKLVLLGIFGGLFIGLGGAVTSTVSHSLTNVGLIRLVSGLLFPFGLITIIITGCQYEPIVYESDKPALVRNLSDRKGKLFHRVYRDNAAGRRHGAAADYEKKIG